ncbi:MAG: gliding motility lipoprotein GldH [Muribaculaceae bacterium]|nr:gliding motility lipoprotein GldH [Muribaculaceae bacterium]
MRTLVRIVFALLLLTFVACEPAGPTEDAGFVSIPPEGWAYGRVLEFVPELADSVGNARVAVAVRHNNDYPYSNLWLELTAPIPGTDSARVDTIDLDMADVYGHWYGTGAGMSYIVVDTLRSDYLYENGRAMKLRHIMRADTVTDITQVGLIFMLSEADTNGYSKD